LHRHFPNTDNLTQPMIQNYTNNTFSRTIKFLIAQWYVRLVLKKLVHAEGLCNRGTLKVHLTCRLYI